MNTFYLKQCFLVFAMFFLCLPFCFVNAQENSIIEIENLPYYYSGTTCGMENNYDDLPISYCTYEQYYYLNGKDILFSFLPLETGCYSFSLANRDTFWTALHIFDGNPYDSNTSCIDFISFNSETNIVLNVNERTFVLFDSDNWYDLSLIHI